MSDGQVRGCSVHSLPARSAKHFLPSRSRRSCLCPQKLRQVEIREYLGGGDRRICTVLTPDRPVAASSYSIRRTPAGWWILPAPVAGVRTVTETGKGMPSPRLACPSAFHGYALNLPKLLARGLLLRALALVLDLLPRAGLKDGLRSRLATPSSVSPSAEKSATCSPLTPRPAAVIRPPISPPNMK